FFIDKEDTTASPRELTLQPTHTRRVFSNRAPIDLEFFADGPAGGWSELWSLVYLPKSMPSKGTEGWLPSDGLLFLSPDVTDKNLGNIRGNLKWHRPGTEDQTCFENYLVHLGLALRAEARANNARVTEICTAVPSVLPQS